MADDKQEKVIKNDEAKKESSLSEMLESGDFFMAQGKRYKIKPLKLKEVEEFLGDEFFTNANHFLNFVNDKTKNKLNKWIELKVFCNDGKPASLDDLINDDWDLDDLSKCMRKMLRLSG